MMRRTTTLVLLTAATLVSSQDTTSNPLLQPPRPSINTATTSNTREIVTAATCIPEAEQVFSIQTDTEAYLSPLTITPICGQTEGPAPDTSASVTGGIIGMNSTIIGGGGMGGNATMRTTTSSTTTTTSSGDDQDATTTTTEEGGSEGTGAAQESGAETTTQSGSGAGKAIVGRGLAGVLGAVAGIVML